MSMLLDVATSLLQEQLVPQTAIRASTDAMQDAFAAADAGSRAVLDALHRKLATVHAQRPAVVALLLLAFVAEMDAQQRRKRSPTLPGSSSTTTTTTSSSRAAGNQLAGLPIPGAAAVLMELLGEAVNPDMLNVLASRIEELGADEAWQAFLEARAKHDAGGEVVADGSRRRTLGGVYLKVLGSRRSAARLAAHTPAVPPHPGPQQLRPYQQRVVDAVSSGRGNHVLVAPTGSGKTLVPVEVARRVLAQDAEAKVLMLVPVVTLTTQQARAFMVNGVAGIGVGCFSSADTSLTASTWDSRLSACSVLVATPQVLVNVLALKPDALCGIRLLVFDEVHHVTKDHPFMRVLRVWHQLEQQGRPVPQLLGLTASPAADATADGTADLVLQLGRQLNAKFHHVDESDPELQQVLAVPSELEVPVPSRPVDGEVWHSLLEALADMLVRVGGAAEAAVAEAHELGPKGYLAMARLEQLRKHLSALRPASAAGIQALGQAGRETLLNQVSRALKEAVGVAKQLSIPELSRCMHLAQEVRLALHIVEDGGFEAAFSFLGTRLYELQQRCRQPLPANPAAAAASGWPAAASLLLSQLDGTAEDLSEDEEGDDDDDASLLGPSASQAAHSVAATSGATPSAAPPLQFGSSAPLIRAARPAGGGGGGAPAARVADAAAAAAVPWGLRSSELVWRLASHSCLGRPELVLRSCEPVAAGRSFPRMVALVEYLRRHRDKPQFHGIVFVRQRQVVDHLARQLRSCASLGFVDEVLELVGHGASGPQRAGGRIDLGGPGGCAALPGPSRHPAHKGMSGDQQQQVMERFKAPGRRLLVSTAAAEEGVDIPACSFVVRYNAATSGVQRVQSKGRSRAPASEFVTLVQQGAGGWGSPMAAREGALHAKSQLEEDSMRQVLGQLKIF